MSMDKDPLQQRGRGSSLHTPNRFQSTHIEAVYDDLENLEVEEWPRERTQFIKDHSRSIINKNDSPDVGFNYSINAYRGCEHGCAYCYARPGHEYLGYSAGLDFETKIVIKENAPQLLREKLMSPKWQPECITMSGVTDCYQPAERKFELTRGCLKVLAEFRHPVFIITKNRLVTRDLDLLKELAQFQAAAVFLSITTLDADLCGVLEPRTSRPLSRLKAVEQLASAGIPVGVNVAPVIPGLTDHEMPSILNAAASAGAQHAGFTVLRLPWAVLPIFTDWLERHRPLHAKRALARLRELRGGKLYDAEFGKRMRGEGEWAANLEKMFRLFCRKEGLNQKDLKLSCQHFVRPSSQLEFQFGL